MKTLSIIGLLIACALGGFLFYARTQKPGAVDGVAASGQSSGSSLAQAEVRVTVLAGALEVELPGGQSKTIAGQTKISAGTTIKTPEASRALIEFTDGAIARLEGRSTLRLKEISANAAPFVTLELLSGRLFVHSAQPPEASALWYTVLTPNATIAMGNHALDIVRLAGKTKIINFKDTASVTPRGPDTDMNTPAPAALALRFLESTTIDDTTPHGPFSVIPVTPETIQIDPWLIYNIEQELKRGAPLPAIAGVTLSIPTPTPTPAPQALNAEAASRTSEKTILP
ncbi:MAG: FecR domain-containing protein [bacterium]|nr:FecR domain-containing protein [bacterium]MDZ4296208.1 FecR domain-containing protein [Patescibacteria group bacterium]